MRIPLRGDETKRGDSGARPSPRAVAAIERSYERR